MLKNVHRLQRLNKNVIYYELTMKNASFCSQEKKKKRAQSKHISIGHESFHFKISCKEFRSCENLCSILESLAGTETAYKTTGKLCTP